MAVQTKSSVGGKPRQKKDINWMQVGVVSFCILLLVMCIVSFSNLGNIFNQKRGVTTFGILGIGDPAHVDYTMYIDDIPMVTSSIDVFSDSPACRLPMLTQTLDLVSGRQMDVADRNPLLINSSYEYPFWMLKQEYNQIATGIVGLAVGESRTVKSLGSSFQTTYTKNQMKEMGIDYADWTIGTIGLMNYQISNENNNTTTMVIRPALVINETADEMIIQYGYDTIVMKVV
ncbi:MAG: hypothetical protein LBH02_02500 [Methanocalculaceae archaeon]|nr:hypothetical protein [Methanocalculaceae archaeon]